MKKTCKPDGAAGREDFTRLLKKNARQKHYHLRLYVIGTTQRSAEAIRNIRAICDEFLAGRYDLEITDIQRHPARAVLNQIIAVPTLVKHSPGMPKRFFGSLSDRNAVIVGLELGENAEETKWFKYKPPVPKAQSR